MSWRPAGWGKINPQPIGTPMGYAFNSEDLYKHGEKCADAILEALWELARQSPTKTFTIDANTYQVFPIIPDEKN